MFRLINTTKKKKTSNTEKDERTNEGTIAIEICICVSSCSSARASADFFF